MLPDGVERYDIRCDDNPTKRKSLPLVLPTGHDLARGKQCCAHVNTNTARSPKKDMEINQEQSPRGTPPATDAGFPRNGHGKQRRNKHQARRTYGMPFAASSGNDVGNRGRRPTWEQGQPTNNGNGRPDHTGPTGKHGPGRILGIT